LVCASSTITITLFHTMRKNSTITVLIVSIAVLLLGQVFIMAFRANTGAPGKPAAYTCNCYSSSPLYKIVLSIINRRWIVLPGRNLFH
jgi:hypothetical protein